MNALRTIFAAIAARSPFVSRRDHARSLDAMRAFWAARLLEQSERFRRERETTAVEVGQVLAYERCVHLGVLEKTHELVQNVRHWTPGDFEAAAKLLDDFVSTEIALLHSKYRVDALKPEDVARLEILLKVDSPAKREHERLAELIAKMKARQAAAAENPR